MGSSTTTAPHSSSAVLCPICGKPIGLGVNISFPPAPDQYHDTCVYRGGLKDDPTTTDFTP